MASHGGTFYLQWINVKKKHQINLGSQTKRLARTQGRFAQAILIFCCSGPGFLKFISWGHESFQSWIGAEKSTNSFCINFWTPSRVRDIAGRFLANSWDIPGTMFVFPEFRLRETTTSSTFACLSEGTHLKQIRPNENNLHKHYSELFVANVPYSPRKTQPTLVG